MADMVDAKIFRIVRVLIPARPCSRETDCADAYHSGIVSTGVLTIRIRRNQERKHGIKPVHVNRVGERLLGSRTGGRRTSLVGLQVTDRSRWYFMGRNATPLLLAERIQVGWCVVSWHAVGLLNLHLSL